MKLGVVILHWEDDHTTGHCLHAVLIAADRASESCSTCIYVIDNGSKEPLSLQTMNEHLQIEVSVIRNSDNLGFAGGMNVGISEALSEDVDAVWLLNNDTRPQPLSISALVAYHKRHPSLACLGSTIAEGCGERIATVGGYRYEPWSSRAKPLGRGCAVNEANHHTQTYDYVCGSAIFLTAACLKSIKHLPNHNFLYFEELYLAEVIESHSLASGVCADAIVIHHQGSAVSRISVEQQHFYLTESALNYTKHSHKGFLPTVIFARLLRACITAAKTADLAPLKGFVAGLKAFALRKSSHVKQIP